MTHPWDSGPVSQNYFNELNNFNAQRDQFYQTLLNGLQQTGQAQRGLQPTAQIAGPTAVMQQSSQQQPVDQWQDEDLVGAARFYGIDESVARHMPRDVLIQQVNQYRNAARPDESTFGHRVGAAADMLMAVPEMVGIGALEAVTGGLGKLPFIGGALRRNKYVHEADMFARELEESVRSSTPEDFQWVNSLSNVTGNLGAMWIPAGGAYKLASRGVAWIGNPLIRASLAGGISGEALMGGTDTEHWYERPFVLGAGLGAGGKALEPMIGAIAAKLGRRFVPPVQPEMTGEAWPINRMSQTSDMTVLANAAAQGDESAQAMLNDLQQRGVYPDHTPSNSIPPEIRTSAGMQDMGVPVPGVEQADHFATAMNKVGQIIESPAVARVAKQAMPDEASVAMAATEKNPGGVNIVEGIPDPSTFLQEPVATHTAFASRNGRLAALTSDQPISEQMVGEFEKHGMFSGQTVLTGGGNEVTIEKISSKGVATLRYPHSELTFQRSVEELSPQLNSPGVHAVPGLYEHFDAFADNAALETMMSMGLKFDPAVHQAIQTQNMAGWVEDYLDFIGATSKGDRARLTKHINDQWVQSFKALAPEETAHVAAIQQDAEELLHETKVLQFPRRNDMIAHQATENFPAITWGEIRAQNAATHQPMNIRPDIIGMFERASQSLAPEITTRERTSFDPGPPDGSLLGYKTREVHQLHFDTPAGPVSVTAEQTSPTHLEVNWIGMGQGMSSANQLGPRLVRQVGKQLLAEFPGVTTIGGERVTGISAQADELRRADFSIQTVVGELDEHASTKGFAALPNQKGGWSLMDLVHADGPATTIDFEGPEAALTYLKKLNRDLPDLSFNTDVPGELAGQLLREPPPEINTNAQFAGDVQQSAAQLAQTPGGPPAVPPTPPLVGTTPAAQTPHNPIGLDTFWKDGFLAWEPQRRVFSKAAGFLWQKLNTDFGMARAYDNVGVSLNLHHTAMNGPQNELADIFSHTAVGSTKRLFSGEWIDTWLHPQQLQQAQQRGWGQGDIASLDAFDQWLDKIGGRGTAAQLKPMVQTMRQQASLGQNPWTGAQVESPSIMSWYKNSAGSSFNIRELDPRRLGDSFLRGVMWDQNMKVPWEAASQIAETLRQNPGTEEFGHYLDNWLDIVKHGYRSEDDIALKGIHATGRLIFGKSFSETQAKELVSMGMNATHASFLGYRVHVMARDILQLLFAVPRAGPDLLNVIGKFTTDGAYRNSIWQEVLAAGGASPHLPTMAAPGALTGELEMAGAGVAPADMSRRMEAMGQATGFVRDIAPDFLKGSNESILAPMYLYGKQGQMMRTLVFKAGQIKADRAIGAFRQAGINGNLDQLMGESGARTFDRAWQEQFKQLIANGADKEAGQFLGRQLADATQFKYGTTEAPQVARNVTGKLFMQFGSYQNQFLQMLRESTSNGSVADRAKTWIMMGGITTALAAASKQTGWNFRYMNPYALGFGGGPMIGTGSQILEGVSGTFQTLNQGETPWGNRAMNAGGQGLAALGQSLNPLQGMMNTAQGVGMAINDSPTPGMALARLAVTGERGAMPDILNSIAPVDFSAGPPNPVRLNQMQLGTIPRMQVVNPQGAVFNQLEISDYVPRIEPPHPTSATPPDPQATAQIHHLFGEAERLLGTPFQLGGRSIASGLDCAEFIRVAYNKIGYSLPEGTAGLSQAGAPVASFNEIRPGDILLFDVEHWDHGVDHPGSDRIPDHSALYAGNGKILHDTSSGGGVRYDELDSPYGKLIMSGLHSIRRVIQNTDPNAAFFNAASYQPRADVPQGLADQLTEIFPQMENSYMRRNAIQSSRATNSNGTGLINQQPNNRGGGTGGGGGAMF